MHVILSPKSNLKGPWIALSCVKRSRSRYFLLYSNYVLVYMCIFKLTKCLLCHVKGTLCIFLIYKMALNMLSYITFNSNENGSCNGVRICRKIPPLISLPSDNIFVIGTSLHQDGKLKILRKKIITVNNILNCGSERKRIVYFPARNLWRYLLLWLELEGSLILNVYPFP